VAAESDVLTSSTTARDAASTQLAAHFSRVATGDEHAFAELYDATAARVYGLALRIVRDPAQAEEVAQEAYVEIWRTSGRFDPRRGTAISWVLMITHAAAVNRVRSAQASTNREEKYHRRTQPLMLVRPDATHEVVRARFEAMRVHVALAELSPVQRDALNLVYFGGCTHPEAAARLGLPLGTAKSRIRAGLTHLRELMDDR